MSDKKIEDVVYEDGLNLDFVADQLAGVDSMLTFVIDCIRTAENFKHLQEKLTNGLTAVSITKAINVDEYLKANKTGFVAMVKRAEVNSDEEPRGFANLPDYYRNDEGIPVIFPTLAALTEGIGTMVLVRVIDLAEEAARRDQ